MKSKFLVMVLIMSVAVFSVFLTGCGNNNDPVTDDGDKPIGEEIADDIDKAGEDVKDGVDDMLNDEDSDKNTEKDTDKDADKNADEETDMNDETIKDKEEITDEKTN